jgi:hypothetical protein
VPLVSGCCDVKRVFGVEKCEYPVSDLDLPKFRANVTFARKTNRWKVPANTVTEVILIFKQFKRVPDFEPNLSGYQIIPEADVPSQTIYKNDKRGIMFTTEKIDNEDYVMDVRLYPKGKRGIK